MLPCCTRVPRYMGAELDVSVRHCAAPGGCCARSLGAGTGHESGLNPLAIPHFAVPHFAVPINSRGAAK